MSQLFPTNPYWNIIKDHAPNNNPQPPQNMIPYSTSNNTLSLTLNDDKMVPNKSKCTSALEHHDCTSKTCEVADIFIFLKRH